MIAVNRGRYGEGCERERRDAALVGSERQAFGLAAAGNALRHVAPHRVPRLTHSYEMSCSFDPRKSAALVGSDAFLRAVEVDSDGAFPTDDLAALHRAGLLLAPFPTGMGGIGLGSDREDPTALMDVLVAIGRGSLSLGRIYEGHVNAVKLVTRYGSDANLLRMREEAAAGRLSGVWMAEDGTPLRLVTEDGIARLKGHKILASGAGHIRRPLIAAATAAGSLMVIPYVEERRRVDASSWTTLGMRATATGTVDFTDIALADDEIVGAPNDYMRSPLFRGGAWRVIATQLGGVEAVLDLFRAQLAGGRSAGDPLQLARFGEALIAVETARLWVVSACRKAEGGEAEPAAIDAYVDLARNAFEQSALRVIALAQKTIGLRAFVRPNPMERVIRDLTTYMRQPALDASLQSAATFHLGAAETA